MVALLPRISGLPWPASWVSLREPPLRPVDMPADDEPSGDEGRDADAEDPRTGPQRAGRKDGDQQQPHPEHLERSPDVVHGARHRGSTPDRDQRSGSTVRVEPAFRRLIARHCAIRSPIAFSRPRSVGS